jgi:ABC-2 type transport system ATP-binding protein
MSEPDAAVAPPRNDAPLLAATNLRVDLGGAAVLDRVSFQSRGRSIAIVGDGHGLVASIAGQARVRSGNLVLRGHDVARRQHRAAGRTPTDPDGDLVGIAPLDPPLPDRITAREYLAWSARLAGIASSPANKLAASTLASLDLDRLAKSRLDELPLPERRALVIAQAVVTGPAVLVATAPLSGLSGQAATYVERVLATAARDRAWIVSLSSVHAGSPEHTVAAAADDLLVFASGSLVRAGKLRRMEDESSAFSLMIRGRTAGFRAALEARGVGLSGGPRRFFVDLPPEMTTQDLLALSVQVGAPIVELLPRIMASASSLAP